MLKMAVILSRHNRSILAPKRTTVPLPCNCQHKAECFLNSNCCNKAIVYKASISTDGNNLPKFYNGCCKMKFKSHFYNHHQTFKNKQKRHTTEPLKAFWEAIDNGKDSCFEWSILANSNTYQPGATMCNLCLDEKQAILLADPSSILNKRIEPIGKCHHKNKFKLKNFS